MTRPWGSHTRSALGVKKRTDLGALGPSRSVSDVFRSSSTNHRYGINGQVFIAQENNATTGSQSRWYCYDPAIGTCGSAPSLNDDTISFDEVGLTESDDGKWWSSVVDLPAAYDYIDRPASEDLWQYLYTDPSAGPNRCYALLYHADTTPAFGTVAKLPVDTYDDATTMVVAVDAVQTASRLTGPSCTGTWSPGDPGGSFNYYTDTGASFVSYLVYTRTAVGAPWVLTGGPWDAPVQSDFSIVQTTGKIWWIVNNTDFKVFDAASAYSAGTATTVTIPASTIDWWMHWGRITIVKSAAGVIYVYRDTTLIGPLGAPFDSAAWDNAQIDFGWLIITNDVDTLYFYRVTDEDGCVYRQTVTREDGQDEFVTVGNVTEDCAVSGTWSRLLYDHSTGLWSHGGVMPHLLDRYAEGYRWNGTVYRHLIMRKNRTDVTPNGYYYDLVQVI